ncbi:unnamed protein product, partial [Discosporangium mesarthrocarpum]
FDGLLDYCLLYPSEKAQLLQAFAEQSGKVPPSEIYGPEHLLRLMATLPRMLTPVENDEGYHGGNRISPLSTNYMPKFNGIMERLAHYLEQGCGRGMFDRSYMTVPEGHA